MLQITGSNEKRVAFTFLLFEAEKAGQALNQLFFCYQLLYLLLCDKNSLSLLLLGSNNGKIIPLSSQPAVVPHTYGDKVQTYSCVVLTPDYIASGENSGQQYTYRISW